MDPNIPQAQDLQNNQPAFQQELNNTKSFHFSAARVLTILLVIIIILGLVGASYYLGTQKSQINNKEKKSDLQMQSQAVNKPIPTSTANIVEWKTYSNNKLGYSLKYPSDWMLNANYKDPEGGLREGETISITDKDGDVLLFDYGYRPLGVPVHVFKKENVVIAGQQMIKTYNDGCGFTNTNINIETDCKNKTTEFYQITYSTPDLISNDPTVADSNPSQNNYAWATGLQSVSIGMDNLHGTPSYLAFTLKNRRVINDPTFQTVDNNLNEIISSLVFTRQNSVNPVSE